MPQKQSILPLINNTNTKGELNYWWRRLKHNKVRLSETEFQKNNSSETSSEPEQANPEDPDKVEQPQKPKWTRKITFKCI